MQTPAGYRRFDSLLPAEQQGAIAALDRAADELLVTGADAAAVRAAARTHTGALALAPDGGHALLVEVPQRPSDPRTDPDPIVMTALVSTSTFGDALDEAMRLELGPADRNEAILILLCRGEVRPMALVDGLKLLASPESPALVLGRRRTELAQLREQHQARKRGEAEAVIAESRRQQDYSRAHAKRSAEWNKLPREVQLLIVAAHRAGLQPLARALGDVYSEFQRRGGSGELYYLAPPDDWRPDLIVGPRPSLLDGATPSTNGSTVTSEAQS